MAERTPPRFSVRHAPRVRSGMSQDEMAEALTDLLNYAAELDAFLTLFVSAVYEDLRALDARVKALEAR